MNPEYDLGQKHAFVATTRSGVWQNGMTYHQWMVGKIASAMAANPTTLNPEEISKYVVDVADSIINELEKRQSPQRVNSCQNTCRCGR